MSTVRFDFDDASTDQREQMATLLEREAAALRRGDFTADLWANVDDDHEYGGRNVNLRLRWNFGGPTPWVDTLNEYHGHGSDRSYDSRHVRGRYAHAYLNAHDPDSGDWRLRVHQRDDSSHHGERWFGGRVLYNATNGGFLSFTREAAINAADVWAHHGELPDNAKT